MIRKIAVLGLVFSLSACGGGDFVQEVTCTGYGQDVPAQFTTVGNLKGEMIPLAVEGRDPTLPGYDVNVGAGSLSDRAWSATPTDEERWAWARLPNAVKESAPSVQSWQSPTCLSPRAIRAQTSWDSLLRGFRTSTRNPRWVPDWMNSIVA